MIDAGLFFETINGAWSIALAFMVVFVGFYLYEMGREIGWRSFMFDRPLPEQFAIAILIADTGNLMVRSATWVWRTMDVELTVILIIGATIGSAGILCKLRVISIARFGHWPWVTCLIAMAIYVLGWVWYRLA